MERCSCPWGNPQRNGRGNKITHLSFSSVGGDQSILAETSFGNLHRDTHPAPDVLCEQTATPLDHSRTSTSFPERVSLVLKVKNKNRFTLSCD